MGRLQSAGESERCTQGLIGGGICSFQGLYPQFLETCTQELIYLSTKDRYLGKQSAMLTIFGDVWKGCTSIYIHISDWSRSCSEEGPLF